MCDVCAWRCVYVFGGEQWMEEEMHVCLCLLGRKDGGVCVSVRLLPLGLPDLTPSLPLPLPLSNPIYRRSM